MEINTNTTKEVILKDDSFDIERLSEYNLTIVLYSDSFCFSVFDVPNNKIIAFENHNLNKQYPLYLNELKDIFTNHIYVQAGYWSKISIIFTHSNFAFAEITKFKESEISNYLIRNSSIINETDYCHKNVLEDVKLVEVFVCDKNILQFFDDLYPEKELDIRHHLGVFTQICHKLNIVTRKQISIILLIDKQFVSVTALNKMGEIIYSNVFYYSNLNDMVYYVLFTLDLFKVKQDQTDVIAWGNITRDSEHFKNLSKYLMNFKIGIKVPSLKYSYLLDELEPQQYLESFAINIL